MRIKKIDFVYIVLFTCIFMTNIVVANASNNWGSKSVKNIQRQGVMVGYPNGQFNDNQYATRKEMAVAIDRTMDRFNTNTYIIEENKNLILVLLAGILGFILGVVGGYIIAKKSKIVVDIPSINVNIPEIKIPAIKIPEIIKSTGKQVQPEHKTFTFGGDEKYKPTADTFKEALSGDVEESNIVVKEKHGEENKDSLKNDLDKLSQFNI